MTEFKSSWQLRPTSKWFNHSDQRGSWGEDDAKIQKWILSFPIVIIAPRIEIITYRAGRMGLGTVWW